jgi:alpha-galactosidase
MSKVVDRLCKAVPQAIVDFDITEDGRCVGLQFLAAGKYFIINNGPYYHNFDVAPAWKSVLPSGNANIFVQPGPARGWFVRSVLDYEPWIPSVLFLTHYQPDEPRNSQLINIASLILRAEWHLGRNLKNIRLGRSSVSFDTKQIQTSTELKQQLPHLLQTGSSRRQPGNL